MLLERKMSRGPKQHFKQKEELETRDRKAETEATLF